MVVARSPRGHHKATCREIGEAPIREGDPTGCGPGWAPFLARSPTSPMKEEGTLCSYQCNIWFADTVCSILQQFLKLGRWSEACFAPSTGHPSLALLLGVAHPLLGKIIQSNMRVPNRRSLGNTFCCIASFRKSPVNHGLNFSLLCMYV